MQQLRNKKAEASKLLLFCFYKIKDGQINGHLFLAVTLH
ncbi:hypothetical protein N581_08520 [Lactobacillus jensenii MD IIE-70(2)]|nr:hypothetical protein N581_08520 [Lactobacillus jensenii MD IIE-70(2)]